MWEDSNSGLKIDIVKPLGETTDYPIWILQPLAEIQDKEKVNFMSQILVYEYWTILDHFLHSSIVCFWMSLAHSKERKYHIFGAIFVHQNVPVFTNTGTFQYLGPEVYFSPRE